MKYFFPLSLLIMSTIFTSCDEGIVPGSTITVNGQLTHSFSYLEDYLVEIDGKIATTDGHGKFTIQDVEVPYDIFVMLKGGRTATVFKDVSTTEPFLNLSVGNVNGYHGNFEQIVTTIPFLTSGQRAISSFIPQNDVQVYCSSGWGVNKVITNIHWEGAASINGKQVILYFTYENDKIVSYDRFYEKNVTLSSQIHYDTIFTGDPFIDPVESHVSGTIVNPLNNSASSSKATLGFQNNMGFIQMESMLNSSKFNYIVPETLPIDFIFKVNVNASNYSGYPISQINKILLPGTSNNVINLHSPSYFISPLENDSISLYNSQIMWNQSDGNGIYMIDISAASGGSSVRIFTISLEEIIPNLSSFGFTYEGSGTIYRIAIWKYYNFLSMDDFLSKNGQIEKYEGVSASDYYNIRVY